MRRKPFAKSSPELLARWAFAVYLPKRNRPIPPQFVFLSTLAFVYSARLSASALSKVSTLRGLPMAKLQPNPSVKGKSRKRAATYVER